MRPTLLHGIILLFLMMAFAAFSKPAAEPADAVRPGPAPLTKADSALSAPDKKPARAKPEKSAAPLAKPESGDEAESEETKEVEEEAMDCDECVLAAEGQVLVPFGLARAGSVSASALAYPG